MTTWKISSSWFQNTQKIYIFFHPTALNTISMSDGAATWRQCYIFCSFTKPSRVWCRSTRHDKIQVMVYITPKNLIHFCHPTALKTISMSDGPATWRQCYLFCSFTKPSRVWCRSTRHDKIQVMVYKSFSFVKNLQFRKIFEVSKNCHDWTVRGRDKYEIAILFRIQRRIFELLKLEIVSY